MATRTRANQIASVCPSCTPYPPHTPTHPPHRRSFSFSSPPPPPPLRASFCSTRQSSPKTHVTDYSGSTLSLPPGTPPCSDHTSLLSLFLGLKSCKRGISHRFLSLKVGSFLYPNSIYLCIYFIFRGLIKDYFGRPEVVKK